MKDNNEMPLLDRSSLGMRDGLFDEWDALRRGESTPQKASAIARVATATINSVKMEIEYQKHVRTTLKSGRTNDNLASLQLGSK